MSNSLKQNLYFNAHVTRGSEILYQFINGPDAFHIWLDLNDHKSEEWSLFKNIELDNDDKNCYANIMFEDRVDNRHFDSLLPWMKDCYCDARDHFTKVTRLKKIYNFH